ncbi:MAG: hypothetical protein EAZ13_03535 [Sphingobacteriia bacterium]|nr:MAG: hypothetical protein EAZ41_06345 [Sphingobacteriia bacterium]TAG31053.1 MAG: hypothetical protein EAZ35_04820 [Sphingobacteriia bacterium]TAH08353.1 MAG: hypothetical protein EAZ13_03535 [Sphingobacteriia bacterium]
MIIGVLKEPLGENRVSLLPEQASVLVRQGNIVWLEKNAGANAFSPDDAYSSGEVLIQDRSTILAKADIILCY